MQGSLLLKEAGYVSTIQEALHMLGVPPNSILFKSIANSDIVGAIKLLTG